MITRRLALPVIACAALSVGAGEAPEHYKNDPKNLNPDPNYVPGPYVMPDQFAARTEYEAKKAELNKLDELGNPKRLVAVGGEVSFFATKNESARVQGYFRNFVGAVKLGPKAIESMDLLIDINSLDTAVPGRNYRIINLFFDATAPELGTAHAKFDKFDLKGKSMKDLEKGKLKAFSASGTLMLNGKSVPISADLKVEKKGNTFVVETDKPLVLKISDFDYGAKAMELMKECNHKALGNAVEVVVKLAFR